MPPGMSARLLCLALALAVAWAIFRRAQRDHASPGCEMTYMYPGYSEEKLEHAVYRLMSYSEEDPRLQGTKRDWPTVPVLFIPGNAASYKQVRSLAAESTRQRARREHDEASPVLQWFVVDLREQLAAFDAGILDAQAEFVERAIAHLVANHLRNSGAGLRRLIVVGHSMGGLVALAAMRQASISTSLDGASVLLLTLATPHAHPPWLATPSMLHWASRNSIYAASMLQRWASPDSHGPEPPPPVDLLVSVHGGPADAQVAPRLSQLSGSRMHTVRTDAMPSAWVEAGHQVVVWCNQVTSTLTAFLLESTHTPAGQLKALATARLTPQIPTLSQPTPSSLPADRSPWAPQCSGFNLAWYLQYLAPKEVTKEALRLSPKSVKAHKLGKLWRWNIGGAGSGSGKDRATGAAALSLVLSSRLPCEEFRVWVVRNLTNGQQEATDVTRWAGEAPPLVPEAHPEVRTDSTAEEVMEGRQYKRFSSWVLALSSEQLKGASQVVVWLATRQLPRGFLLTAQLLPAIEAVQQVPVGIGGAVRPAGAPMVAELKLPHLWLWKILGLHLTAAAARPASLTAVPCWQPLLWRPAVDPASNKQQYTAADLRSGGDGLVLHGAGSGPVFVVADPRCASRVRLAMDPQQQLADLLLELPAWLPGAALLVLVLRFQLAHVDGFAARRRNPPHEDNLLPKRSWLMSVLTTVGVPLYVVVCIHPYVFQPLHLPLPHVLVLAAASFAVSELLLLLCTLLVRLMHTAMTAAAALKPVRRAVQRRVAGVGAGSGSGVGREDVVRKAVSGGVCVALCCLHPGVAAGVAFGLGLWREAGDEGRGEGGKEEVISGTAALEGAMSVQHAGEGTARADAEGDGSSFGQLAVNGRAQDIRLHSGLEGGAREREEGAKQAAAVPGGGAAMNKPAVAAEAAATGAGGDLQAPAAAPGRNVPQVRSSAAWRWRPGVICLAVQGACLLLWAPSLVAVALEAAGTGQWRRAPCIDLLVALPLYLPFWLFSPARWAHLALLYAGSLVMQQLEVMQYFRVAAPLGQASPVQFMWLVASFCCRAAWEALRGPPADQPKTIWLGWSELMLDYVASFLVWGGY